MNQKQSEDFDSTVRRLADEAESVYQAHSWMLMEKLLDQKRRKKILLWYWPFGLFVGALILWGGFHYFSNPKNQSQNSILINNTFNSSDHAEELKSVMNYSIKSTADHVFKNVNNPASAEDISTYDSGKQLDVTNNSNQDHDLVLSKSKTNLPLVSSKTGSIDSKKESLASIKKSSVKKYLGITIPNSTKTHLSKSTTNQLQSPSTPNTNFNSNNINADQSIVEVFESDHFFDNTHSIKENRIIDINPLAINVYPLKYSRKIEGHDLNQKIIQLNTHIHHSAILLGVTFSPEYSGVIHRAYGKLSNSRGFNIGYQINRWSFFAGLEKSTKYYDAKKGDYEIPETSYYYNLKVDNIGAVCNVLQLPLKIQYELIHKKGFSLHAHVGLSSLRMDKEIYNWDYYHKDWSKGHAVGSFASKNWIWLAAASTGLNIQKTITNHFSLSIAPYYQIPLKGVGHGYVKLNSYGSQLGLYYKLASK